MRPARTGKLEQPDRDRLALDRTALANERTYLAWLRTGLAIFAGGLGVMKFARVILPDHVPIMVASVLIVISIAIFVIAAWRYGNVRLRMSHLDVDAMPAWQARAISWLLAACALVSLASIYAIALP
jgi:putative membrane protein